jgi:hypothetical protein
VVSETSCSTGRRSGWLANRMVIKVNKESGKPGIRGNYKVTFKSVLCRMAIRSPMVDGERQLITFASQR